MNGVALLRPPKVVTAEHVSRGGRPAACVPLHGMPAYESETRALYVMESLLVFGGTPTHAPLLLPRSYDMAVIRTQGGGMTALHDDPDAVWSWRPCLYALHLANSEALGSQQELEYRRGTFEVRLWADEREEQSLAFVQAQVQGIKALYGRSVPVNRLRKNARKRLHREYAEYVHALWRDADADLPYLAARERARAILVEHLTPQQRLDLAATDSFFVRGNVNRLYRIELGNGFQTVDPETHEPLVSFCLHPEEWMPHADVALAIKLAIDSGQDGEAEMLSAANPRVVGRRRRSDDAALRRARELEEGYAFYP